MVSVHCGPRLLLPRSREGSARSGRHMHQRGYQREHSHKPCENPGFHWNARPYWKIGKCVHGNFPPKSTPAETTWEESLCSRKARSAKGKSLLAKATRANRSGNELDWLPASSILGSTRHPTCQQNTLNRVPRHTSEKPNRRFAFSTTPLLAMR